MDIGALFKNAWGLFSAHAVPFSLGAVVAAAITFAIQGVFSLIPGLELLGAFVGTAASVLLMMGMARMALDAVDGKTPAFDQLFSAMKERQVDFLLAGLVMVAGALLCGVGLVVTSLLFMLAPFEVLSGRGWQDALRASYERVTSDFGPHLLVWLACMGLGVVGVVTAVGWVVTAPLALLVVASFHRERASPKVIEGEVAPGA